MANPLKGEVEFTALGQQWRAVLDTEAKIAVEDHYGKGFVSIIMDALGEDAADESSPGPTASVEERRAYLLNKMARMRLGYQRAILHAALSRHHPAVKLADVSAIIDDKQASEMVELLATLLYRSNAQGDGVDKSASAEGKASPAPKPKPKRTGRRD